MRQEEIDALLKKIEESAQDVPVPEGLEPEQMMKKLEHIEIRKNKINWKRPAEYGAIAAALLITILTAAQIRSANVTMPDPADTVTAAAPAGQAKPGSSDKPTEETNPVAKEEEQAAGQAEETEAPGASRFAAQSYQEIFEKIRIYKQDDYTEGGYAGMAGAGAPAGSTTEAGAVPGDTMMEAGGTQQKATEELMKNESAADGAEKNFSSTNIQVEGVDEGDVVKTDGTCLYIMSQDNGRIQIVEANGSSPKKRGVISDSSTTRESRVIQDFYINGDRLSVIRQSYTIYAEADSTYDYAPRYADGEDIKLICGNARPAKSITCLETYDISNKDHPKLVGTVSQDGTYKSSRRVDDYIYLFTSYYANDIKDAKTTKGYIPAVNGKLLPYDSIYLPESIHDAGYLVISSVNMKKPTRTTSQKAVMTDGEQFYVSSSNIYIGSTRYDGRASQYDYTELMKFSYNKGNITFKAQGNVDGYLNNQFSMDEYQGKLRLVSTLSYNNGNSTNSLLVLDEDLKLIGEIEDLAPGEQIYSARFMGSTGYFVTFRNMDPLFSVDLTNPRSPKILGELKITGFSEYLHPYTEDLLLGIGREISPDTGNFKGLKLSMFDTSNPKDVTEIHKMVKKSYEYSTAWDNHKAVAISSAKHIVGFAVEDYDKVSRTWDYRYVIYSYDKNKGFKEVLSHKLQDTGNYDNVRGLYIGQWFYVVEDNRVTVFNMNDFVQAGQVKY